MWLLDPALGLLNHHPTLGSVAASSPIPTPIPLATESTSHSLSTDPDNSPSNPPFLVLLVLRSTIAPTVAVPPLFVGAILAMLHDVRELAPAALSRGALFIPQNGLDFFE